MQLVAVFEGFASMRNHLLNSRPNWNFSPREVMVWAMNDVRRYCIMQSEDGSTTSNMQMREEIWLPLRNGYITESACAYGKVGNFHGHACATSSSAELKSTWHTNGEMRVKDTGQWQAAQLCKSQRAIESSRELAIRHCWDTTKSIIGCKEPPYADPHVRWCERSVNESRR